MRAPLLPMLDYAPAPPSPQAMRALAFAYGSAGYLFFLLMSFGTFYVAAHRAAPSLLPLVLVLMGAGVLGAIGGNGPTKAFCWGIFAGTVTLCIPAAAVYLLIVGWVR